MSAKLADLLVENGTRIALQMQMTSPWQRQIRPILLVSTALLALGCSGRAADPTPGPNAGGTDGHTEVGRGGTGGHTGPLLDPQLTRPVAHGNAPADVLVCKYTQSGWGLAAYKTAGLPQFVLYGDGLVVFGPPLAYSYQMRQARVDEAGIQFLLGRLDDVGLFAADIALRTGNVSDAASTTLRLVVDGYALKHSVYPAEDYGDTEQGRALQQGHALLSLGAFPSENIIEPIRALEYSRVSLSVRRVSGPCDDAPLWPLPTLPDLELHARTCLDLDREHAQPFTPLDPGFDNFISMRAGEGCVEVMYRPVLSHEAACTDAELRPCGP